eukprot:gene9465-6781_t
MKHRAIAVVLWIVVLATHLLEAQRFSLSNLLVTSALDPVVWVSTATVFHHHNLSMEIADRPICRFDGVFVDATSIYLVARDHSQAALDLLCCAAANDDADKLKCAAASSVHAALCFCSWNWKYSFHVATPAQLRWLQDATMAPAKGVRTDAYWPGVSWLMHHWSVFKHPDHFSMKLFEVRGLLDNSQRSRGVEFPFLANVSVARLVSLDYPVFPYNDYEQLVMDIVTQTLGPLPHVQLNHNGSAIFAHTRPFLTQADRLWSFCLHLRRGAISNSDPRTAALRSMCASPTMPVLEAPRFPFAYAETGYLSAVYKHNVPAPLEMTMESFRDALAGVLRNTSTATGEQRQPTIVVLYRMDDALRPPLDLDTVARELQRQFCAAEIAVTSLAPGSAPEQQARLFRSFDVLVAAQAAPLRNLIYARNGSAVIQLPTARRSEHEHALRDLPAKVELHYQLLAGEAAIDVGAFRRAVGAAKAHLLASGQFPALAACD